jgi:uncharacterized protein
MTDIGFYVAAVAAVICTGLSKAGFASFGILATPLLAAVVPPLEAVAILLPIMVLQDLVAVWAFRRDWNKRNVLILLPSSAVGICIAWAFASYVPDAYVRLLIGVIALGFALQHWLYGKQSKSAESRPSTHDGVFWGIVAGVSGTLANAAGPPFQMYVLPQKLDKLTFVGTAAVYFAALNVMKLVPIFALGKFSAGNIAVSLALLPLAVGTVYLGVWILRFLSVQVFYNVAHTLLLAVALELIWVGVRQLVT